MGLVRIHTAPNATEGHLLKALLEGEGISVLSNGEGDGPYRMGPLHLWVDESHEVQARLVIAEAESGALALDEDSSRGEASDA